MLRCRRHLCLLPSEQSERAAHMSQHEIHGGGQDLQSLHVSWSTQANSRQLQGLRRARAVK